MPENALSGRRILVVEDEYYLADELASALQRAGADVLGPVSTIEDALELLEREAAPDAAVLDMSLAGEMVFPVADVLSKRGVPFLFTTGFDQSSVPARYAEVRRMEKPVDAATTLRELGKLCGQSPERTL